ncbi:MAG: hypothetical protein QOC87_1898 [Actinomycetota bacterium]|nr:hypothetical protein [Actinomycetota bacterium]
MAETAIDRTGLTLKRADGANRALQVGAAVYLVGLIAHTADHVRRGTDVITPEVFWAGIISTTIGIIVVIMIVARHRLAPLFATAFGFAEAIGVASAHLFPHWSALSDPFIGHQAPGITPFSWAVVLIELAGAFAMGVAGWLVLRRRPD